MYETANHPSNTHSQAIVLEKGLEAIRPHIDQESAKALIYGLVVLGLWGITNGKSVEIRFGQFGLRIK